MASDTVSIFAENLSDKQIYGINIINRDLYAYTASTPNELLDSVYAGHIEEPLPPLEAGDADGNGRVDIRDTTMIQRYTAFIVQLDSRQLAAADVNGDGTVNVADATAIQKQIAKVNTAN